MTDAFTYQKSREEFGRQPNFQNTDTQIVAVIEQDKKIKEQFILKDPKELVLGNMSKFSEHGVNTERVATKIKA
jgi:hypothetical protein